MIKELLMHNAFINKNIYSGDVQRDACYWDQEPELEE